MQKNEIKEALHEYRRERKEEKQVDKVFGFIMIEMAICAGLLGMYFSSWLVFFVVLIGCVMCYMMPIVGVILCVLLSGFWGLVAWWIGWAANDETGSFAAIMFGLIVFAISLGIHLYPRYNDAFLRNK